jgi:hypothetical protein
MFRSLGRLQKKVFSITKYGDTKHELEVLHNAIRVKGKLSLRTP